MIQPQTATLRDNDGYTFSINSAGSISPGCSSPQTVQLGATITINNGSEYETLYVYKDGDVLDAYDLFEISTSTVPLPLGSAITLTLTESAASGTYGITVYSNSHGCAFGGPNDGAIHVGSNDPKG